MPISIKRENLQHRLDDTQKGAATRVLQLLPSQCTSHRSVTQTGGMSIYNIYITYIQYSDSDRIYVHKCCPPLALCFSGGRIDPTLAQASSVTLARQPHCILKRTFPRLQVRSQVMRKKPKCFVLGKGVLRGVALVKK